MHKSAILDIQLGPKYASIFDGEFSNSYHNDNGPKVIIAILVSCLYTDYSKEAHPKAVSICKPCSMSEKDSRV